MHMIILCHVLFCTSLPIQAIAECVSANVASTLHHLVQKHSEALFVNAVLPSFQSSLKEIFAQINEAFKAGMAECEYMT